MTRVEPSAYQVLTGASGVDYAEIKGPGVVAVVIDFPLVVGSRGPDYVRR